jgi:hypothetical protein
MLTRKCGLSSCQSTPSIMSLCFARFLNVPSITSAILKLGVPARSCLNTMQPRSCILRASLLAFSKTTSIKPLSIHTPLKNNARQMTLDKPDIPFLDFTSSNSTQPHSHETNQISPPSTSSQVTQPHKASRCLWEPLPSERKEGCS